MDTTDPDIQFDDQGICNHCRIYDQVVRDYVLTGEQGQRKVEELAARIKRDGTGKQYDCIIGVSGGVDSTYVAYKVKQLGLRPLAVHLDNGWDSELAVKNIEQTLKCLGIDLYTHVLDWEEFRDLQLSFLKASTPDSEIPSDHAIVSLLYHMAKKVGTKYVITGYNLRTESHLPVAWSQGHFDWKYIASVHKQFGTAPLKTFPRMHLLALLDSRVNQEWVHILNYVDYSKTQAMPVLEREIGWKYYGGKHYESIYTRFYQGYWLPRKFGYDKRRTHMSSLICSGEMSRDAALEALKLPTYDPGLQEEDIEYVIKKFEITEEEFERMMALPKKSYWDYPSYRGIVGSGPYKAAQAVYHVLKRTIKKTP